MRNDPFKDTHRYYETSYNNSLIPSTSILDYLKANAEKIGDKVCISEILDDMNTKHITYALLYDQVQQVKEVLIREYKIEKGDHIAVLPDNSINSIIHILSIFMAGATAVILNPMEPKERIHEQLAFADCKMAIYEKEEVKEKLKIQAIQLHEILMKSKSGIYSTKNDCLNTDRNQDSAALIMFTTGTTSASKGVVQSHYNVAINAYSLCQHHNLSHSKTLLCSLPIYYANGLEFTIFATLIGGAHVYLTKQFNPFDYFRIIDQFQINIASLVPSMLATLVDMPIKNSLASLLYFVTAAAPLQKETSQKTLEKLGKKVIQGYGLTETTNFSTLLPIDLDESEYRKWMIECDIPTVGTEVFGNEVAILDRNGNELPIGEVGEICMRGHNVMLGYYKNAEATSKAFKDGWFHSGDLGKLVYDADKKRKYCVITGREKNIIKCGGQAISLDEMDRILYSLNGVNDAAAYGIPDVTFGEVVGVIIERSKKDIDKEDILNELKKYFMGYKLPKKIDFVEKVPRSKNGKLNRKIISQLVN